MSKNYTNLPGLHKSSDEICVSHRVKWEASIQGKVTTPPNAGRVPIKDVTVMWELLHPMETTRKIVRGTVISTDAGSFDIPLIISDYVDEHITNDIPIPVRVSFEKLLTSRDNHKFLCNEGQKDCSNDGTTVYLKHMQFKEPLVVYDATGVPFSGKITVSDTGCGITDAEVCFEEKTASAGVTNILGCSKTDTDGTFAVPINIGSTVHTWYVIYHRHTFVPRTISNDNNYHAGNQVKEGRVYKNHDFIDTSTANLTVEVVGGMCNRTLGKNTIQVRLQGCNWGGKQYIQRGPFQVHEVPAQFVKVQVIDIKDYDDERKYIMWDYFQGTSPQERTCNLTNATTSDAQSATNTNSSSVRFQYDGIPKLTFRILNGVDETNQKGSCPANYTKSNDLQQEDIPNFVHVLKSGQLFFFQVDLYYEIEENVICDMVPDTIKLRFLNQVGANPVLDKEFMDRITDNATKQILTLCTTGCIIDVQHDSLGRNAHFNYSLVTGQPNIISPYTKDINFQLIGVTQYVANTAKIIIVGNYLRGPGESFAFPTHYPVMILRDPPGGKSYVSYKNVATTINVATTE